MWVPDVKLGTDSAIVSWDTIGRKQYELSNHLGNVLATITDKRLQHLNSGNIDYFNADVATAQDYYAFGSLMPGRQYNYAQLYPNGFNGKRNDNDIAGTGNWQDYGQRMYLPWVGRFPNTDPLTKEYPALTPYQFASNSPVAGQDRDGLEFIESGAYATMQNRQYEANLRKTDPKNANAIIRQHNVNAFLVVGGALTAGSGTLATAFWDLIMAGGSARTAQGIINHDKTQTSEGVHAMTGAAMGEIGGFVIGKTFEIVSPLIRNASKSLTGTWIKENISGWSTNAMEYQEFVTGVKAGQTFQVNGYNFDGFKNGTLLDAKSGLGNFVDKQTGNFKGFFKGQESLVIQARNQISAAKGTPIEWDFEIKAVRDATEKLFKEEDVTGITLKYKPKK